MSIHLYPSSPRQLRAFQAGLQQLIQLGRIPDHLPVLPVVLPIYNLGTRDVLANADLGTTAKLVSYRYFAGGDAAGVTVAGDVDAATESRVTSFSYGDSIREDLKAVATVKTHLDLPSDTSKPYELRILRIPGLFTETLWLRSLSPESATDQILPYKTPIIDLKPDPTKESPFRQIGGFYTIIRPFALKALTNDDSPKVGVHIKSSSGRDQTLTSDQDDEKTSKMESRASHNQSKKRPKTKSTEKRKDA